MGKRFDCDMIAKSTFSNQGGTKICQQIESSEVKSIVKNENLVTIQIENEKEEDVYQNLLKHNIIVEAFQKEEGKMQFRIKKADRNKVQDLLDSQYPNCQIKQKELNKLSIIGYGIIQDNQVLRKVLQTLEKYPIEILEINTTQAKIEIIAKEIQNEVVEELHQNLIGD